MLHLNFNVFLTSLKDTQKTTNSFFAHDAFTKVVFCVSLFSIVLGTGNIGYALNYECDNALMLYPVASQNQEVYQQGSYQIPIILNNENRNEEIRTEILNVLSKYDEQIIDLLEQDSSINYHENLLQPLVNRIPDYPFNYVFHTSTSKDFLEWLEKDINAARQYVNVMELLIARAKTIIKN